MQEDWNNDTDWLPGDRINADAAGIVCDCETTPQNFSKQVFTHLILELPQTAFDQLCIRLIQNQHFHESIVGQAGTEEEQYIPDRLKKDFKIKKVTRNDVPSLIVTNQNLSSAGVLPQQCKTPGGFNKKGFLDTVQSMSDGQFQTLCSDIKGYSWEADALSNHLHSDKPFAIPPKLRSNFWITGIDDENFFVYDPLPKHADEKLISDHMHDVNAFIAAVETLPQHEFDALCHNIMLSHFFVYDVSGMAGTDLPEHIAGNLKENFCKWQAPANILLEESHAGACLLHSTPGIVIKQSRTGHGFSKTKLIEQLMGMNKSQFEEFAFDAAFLIDCRFSYQHYLFTQVFNSIPKQQRMYFRYFAVWNEVFSQRLDRYFGENPLNYRVHF